MHSMFQSLPIRLVAFALTMALVFHRAIFLPDSWQGARQPGEMVAGYWRSEKDEACYEDVSVLQFKGENTVAHRYGKSTLFHDKTQITISGNEVILNFPAGRKDGDWGLESSIYLKDHGNKMLAYKIIEDGKSFTKEEFAEYTGGNPKVYDLVQCSNYGMASRLKLIFNAPMKDL